MGMESLTDRFAPGHLTEALVHYNEALDQIEDDRAAVDVAEIIFRCLNKLQTGMAADDLGEVAGFVELVRIATDTEDSRLRFLGDELRDLAALEPQVMDHHTLRRGDYRPGPIIEPALHRGAVAKHRKLVNAFQRLDTEYTLEAIDQVIKRSAELLYIVRSNIAHGEKTPYGPDHAKRERDEAVCQLVVPLCQVLVDLLLACPRRRLLAYGTLAPGEANHALVESLEGEWYPCRVEASLTEDAGLPTLAWQPGSDALVEAMMLHSDYLASSWRKLDAFEGSCYHRRLLPVSVVEENGAYSTVVANAYVGAQVRPSVLR